MFADKEVVVTAHQLTDDEIDVYCAEVLIGSLELGCSFNHQRKVGGVVEITGERELFAPLPDGVAGIRAGGVGKPLEVGEERLAVSDAEGQGGGDRAECGGAGSHPYGHPTARGWAGSAAAAQREYAPLR